MTPMSRETDKDIRDKAEELKGKAKEKVGDWTGNHSMQAEGMVDQAKAKVKHGARDVRDSARDAMDDDSRDDEVNR